MADDKKQKKTIELNLPEIKRALSLWSLEQKDNFSIKIDLNSQRLISYTSLAW